MRSYDIAVASLAVGAPKKWVDNVLSQHGVSEVVTQRRGVSRKLPYTALLRLALVRELHVGLGTSVREALSLAEHLLAATGDGVHVRGHLRVTFDRQSLEQTVDARLRDALESAPAIRRGRPRRRGSHGRASPHAPVER